MRTYAVKVRGQVFCQIPLKMNEVGDITNWAFVADPKNPLNPSALILGTSGKNHIYVYRVAQNQCQQVREYRGHTAAVSSVGVSADNRYLVSSSKDGTVGFWRLDNAFEIDKAKQAWINRWGATFEIVNNRLVVKESIQDGPLYFRGVRTGRRD